jgi:hypothetical protein
MFSFNAALVAGAPQGRPDRRRQIFRSIQSLVDPAKEDGITDQVTQKRGAVAELERDGNHGEHQGCNLHFHVVQTPRTFVHSLVESHCDQNALNDGAQATAARTQRERRTSEQHCALEPDILHREPPN